MKFQVKALITGVNGQDGYYLSSYLLKRGVEILGVSSKEGRDGPFPVSAIDITNYSQVSKLVRKFAPDQIYHLAAVHHSSEYQPMQDFKLFKRSYAVNVQSTLNLLESIRRYLPRAKMFFASSAQIFGNPSRKPQNEHTRREPQNIYGMTKLLATNLCSYYRKSKVVCVW